MKNLKNKYFDLSHQVKEYIKNGDFNAADKSDIESGSAKFAESNVEIKSPGSEKPVGIGEAFGITQNRVDRAKEQAQTWAKDLRESGKYPEPYTEINGKKVLTNVVVSTEDNATYVYDKKGVLTHVFENSLGAEGFDTHKGIRKVASTETYPFVRGFRNEVAVKNGVNNPFGPYTITNIPIDPVTGKSTSDTGEYMHGTNDSIGWKKSHGCMRHKNSDIIVIKDLVKSGNYLNII